MSFAGQPQSPLKGTELVRAIQDGFEVNLDPRQIAELWASASPRLTAQRILTSAASGITPIASVMAAPPTHSVGANNVASTINANGTTLNGSSVPANGRYRCDDTRYIESIGGNMILDPVGTDGVFGQTMISNTSTLVRRGAHGIGLRFVTDAQAFDACINSNGKGIIVYVTDPATGIRARTQANDIVGTTGGNAYYKWDFGSREPRGRVIEIYQDAAQKFRQINVDTNSSIWRLVRPDEPRFAVLWDSYGDQTNEGGATNVIKLGVSDYIGEVLGLANPINLSRSGTGMVNPNGTMGTFLQRIQLGNDLAVSNIGLVDILFMPGSVNDTAYTDQQVQDAAQATYAAAMVAQPNAIIVGAGPEVNVSSPYVSSRFAAYKAGFDAAAGSDPRMIWLDSAPSSTGEYWLSATPNTVSQYIGGDNTHLNSAGVQYYGRRIGNSILAALRRRFGV